MSAYSWAARSRASTPGPPFAYCRVGYSSSSSCLSLPSSASHEAASMGQIAPACGLCSKHLPPLPRSLRYSAPPEALNTHAVFNTAALHPSGAFTAVATNGTRVAQQSRVRPAHLISSEGRRVHQLIGRKRGLVPTAESRRLNACAAPLCGDTEVSGVAQCCINFGGAGTAIRTSLPYSSVASGSCVELGL